MIAQEQIHSLYGREVYDRDGDKIGSIGQVWGDGVGRPAWASVKTGLFGLNESMIPLQDADLQGDRLIVPFEKAVVKDAPNVDAADDEPLAEDEVTRLYDYYNLSWDDSYHAYQAGAAAGNASYAGTQDRETVGYDTSGPTTDDAMTRSEERLDVGTTRQETGRARLRKYVTTEQETVTVPVKKERAVLETEPITEGNVGNATGGPAISEEEHEVVLSEEQVNVSKTAEPVERVRLGTETVSEEETVTEEVRKEHIEAEGDVNDRR
jgi:uncharacterized protein (TIGR02271 family)